MKQISQEIAHMCRLMKIKIQRQLSAERIIISKDDGRMIRYSFAEKKAGFISHTYIKDCLEMDDRPSHLCNT